MSGRELSCLGIGRRATDKPGKQQPLEFEHGSSVERQHVLGLFNRPRELGDIAVSVSPTIEISPKQGIVRQRACFYRCHSRNVPVDVSLSKVRSAEQTPSNASTTRYACSNITPQ